ncbi:hypothetical protein [Flavobacterium wongokense]|uniref:hypothetical protein n=1 Tax=Flavobacterium wongokense TaxID=2910674 RepID=UPI001F372088|nr:hypothetical protein [Flavobacterium sp. WG47]MCF6133042.1 hypothetical protein [Flavobacterium sp. WG47]
MKNSTITNSPKSNLKKVGLLLFVSLLSTVLHAQNYRTIDAYLEDFGKNEMFIKKALMDYTVTIVESQLDSRSKVTSQRIVEKIENINRILKTTDKGFQGNTSLRDSFIKMNERTVESLKNGSLILTDYDYQSSLSLPEIGENLNRKEQEMMTYYQALENYEKDKKYFGSCHRYHFKSPVGKNILEYNAQQNIMFYKLNVMDEKLTKVIAAMDRKGFTECMNMIALMHEQIMLKTAQYNNYFRDNSLNEANIQYSTFINNQQDQLSSLFEEYVTEYEALQALKKSNNAETAENVARYNETVRSYNAKKNAFYSVFNSLQSTKDNMYNNWYVTNAEFLKHNGEFEALHGKFAYND